MMKHSTDGLLFFEGGRELRIVAYDVSRTSAPGAFRQAGPSSDTLLHTVGKCRLAWRHLDNIGVVFERWLDSPSVGHRTPATLLVLDERNDLIRAAAKPYPAHLIVRSHGNSNCPDPLDRTAAPPVHERRLTA
jgi:hypothetical protein